MARICGESLSRRSYWFLGMGNKATGVFSSFSATDIFTRTETSMRMFSCVPARLATRNQSVRIMIGQDSSTRQQVGAKPGVFEVAAAIANGNEYGTLILDSQGRIRSCGATAEEMLGESQLLLSGRRISTFIADLLLGGNSPSYSARYLVYLCAEGEWRKFEAMDARGQVFAVELNLSRMFANGQEVFLLCMRRPEEAARP